MIRIEGLDFAHPGGFRLDVPRLVVAAGETVAVVGPSGTGKTTLLNLVAGILPAQGGRIEVAGEAVSAMPDRARRRLRARAMWASCSKTSRCSTTSRRGATCSTPTGSERGCGSTGRRGRGRTRWPRPAASRGSSTATPQGFQPGRAAARGALPGARRRSPKVVLADEPTGNLDPANKALILGLLFERARAAGAALLAVTHDHELLPQFDRVVDLAAPSSEAAA